MSDNAVPDTQVVQSQDQANPEIQDQATPAQEQSEQPTMDSPSPEEELIEINGQKLSKKEIAEGLMRQEDYTRKTQELAEKQRLLSRSPSGDQVVKSEELPPEAQKFIETLKDKGGFMTKAEYEQKLALEQDTNQFNKLIEDNPHLKPFKEAVYRVGMQDPRSWNDIIKDSKYGFSNLKPKNKPVREVGGGAPSMKEDAPKSVKDMSPEEYDSWKKTNLKGTKFV